MNESPAGTLLAQIYSADMHDALRHQSASDSCRTPSMSFNLRMKIPPLNVEAFDCRPKQAGTPICFPKQHQEYIADSLLCTRSLPQAAKHYPRPTAKNPSTVGQAIEYGCAEQAVSIILLSIASAQRLQGTVSFCTVEFCQIRACLVSGQAVKTYPVKGMRLWTV